MSFSDDFNRADTTDGLGISSSGHLWHPQQAWSFAGVTPDFDKGQRHLDVVSNQCYTRAPDASADVEYWAEAVDAGSADITLSCDIFGADRLAEEAGHYVRKVSSQKFWTIFITHNGANYVLGIRVYDGASTATIHTINVGGAGTSPHWTLTTEITGDNWTITSDRLSPSPITQTYSFTDSRHNTGTVHGIEMRPSTFDLSGFIGMRIDDVNLSPFSPGSPLRLTPRDDNLITGARVFPTPSSRQAGRRLFPTYD